jgi:hypothetical protein
VAGGLGERTRLAVARDRADHELRVPLEQRHRIEPEPGHHPRAELFDQHIRRGEHDLEPLAVGRVLEVELDDLLAGVQHLVDERAPVRERGHAPHVLPAGPFDLDHPRTCRGEDPGGERARQEGGEIDHRQIAERRHQARAPSPRAIRIFCTSEVPS